MNPPPNLAQPSGCNPRKKTAWKMTWAQPARGLNHLGLAFVRYVTPALRGQQGLTPGPGDSSGWAAGEGREPLE